MVRKDSYRAKGLRKKLILTLRQEGIKDEKVLAAMMRVPRHFFVDPAFMEWAYKDAAFPIDNYQTISRPHTVALQTSLLNLSPDDKVLEVGTGSGYQAAVLSEMGVKVYSIERQEGLFRKTYTLLEDIGYGNIRLFYGDGFEGLPRYAPYDKIVVTAGATKIPHNLIHQLKIGGIMVIPIGEDYHQEIIRLRRKSESELLRERIQSCSFVPFLRGTS